MGIAVRHFAERQTNMVALLKTLGASRRSLWQLMGTLLLSLTLVGALLGLVAGSAMQWLTLHLLGNLLPADLPPPSWRPFALGLAVAFFITLLLAFVPFLRLLKVPPLRVLRRELEAGIPPWLALPVALLGLFGLVWGFTADATLALGLIGGMGLLMGLLALIASCCCGWGAGCRGPTRCGWPSAISPASGAAVCSNWRALRWHSCCSVCCGRRESTCSVSSRLGCRRMPQPLPGQRGRRSGRILADLRQAGP